MFDLMTKLKAAAPLALLKVSSGVSSGDANTTAQQLLASLISAASRAPVLMPCLHPSNASHTLVHEQGIQHTAQQVPLWQQQMGPD